MFVFFFLLIFLNFSVSAQTTWFFVTESPAPQDTTLPPVFYSLISALANEEDRISVVTYSDTPLFLTPPIPARREFDDKITEKLLETSAKDPVKDKIIAGATSMADEQAEAYGITEGKLVIITGGRSRGKAPNLDPPGSFPGGVYYIALDSEPADSISDIAESGVFTITSEDLPRELKTCLSALAPDYKTNIFPDETEIFKSGSLIKTVSKGFAILRLYDGEDFTVQKNGVAIADKELFQTPSYAILPLKDTGDYTATGGSFILSCEKQTISPVFLIAAIVLVIVIAIIFAAAKSRKH